jgi:hypothetical protein
MTKHLETVILPTPLPFDGVDFCKRTSMRYHSGFDVFELIAAAEKELARKAPEQCKRPTHRFLTSRKRRPTDPPASSRRASAPPTAAASPSGQQ